MAGAEGAYRPGRVEGRPGEKPKIFFERKCQRGCRILSVWDQITRNDLRQSTPHEVMVSQDRRSLKSRFARAIYLLAIAVATLGWLWFFAWIARKLIELVFGSGQ
jgi:hypothetical protein